MKRLVAIASSVALFGISWYMLKRKTKRALVVLPRQEFIRIMEEISLSGFDILFEYAQMVARVGASMKSGIDIRSFIESDSNLRFELENRQGIILRNHNVTVEDMMHCQSVYKSDDEVVEKTRTITNMFEQYCEGSFPVIPWIPRKHISDEALIHVVEGFMKSRMNGTNDSAMDLSTRNEISHRINEQDEFRNLLFSTVVGAQNEVRNSL
jgi:hypothetical protein